MKNFNIIAYSIYLIICVLITVFVGRDLHKKGYHLINNLFEHTLFSNTINNMLLMAYYLFNIGYIAITLLSFNTIQSNQMMIETLSTKIGTILLLLGVLHFNNIILLTVLSKHKQKLIKYIIS